MMMIHEIIEWIPAAIAGVVLGLFFYGGLWWTTRKGLSSEYAGLWFFTSLMVRTAVVLAGFYFIAGSDWRKILICLVGFTISRLIIVHYQKDKAAYLAESKTNDP